MTKQEKRDLIQSLLDEQRVELFYEALENMEDLKTNYRDYMITGHSLMINNIASDFNVQNSSGLLNNRFLDALGKVRALHTPHIAVSCSSRN